MDDNAVPPPPRPPPLLSPESLRQLCTHGYLGLDLPYHLANKYDQLLAASDAFFAQPVAAKLPYRPGIGLGPGHRGPLSNANNTERGYTRLAGEKEYLTLRKSMTHLPPGILDAAAPVWHDTAHLLHRILGDIGVYLGLRPTAWDAVVADSLEPGDGVYAGDKTRAHPRNDPPTLLRLFRYEPGGGGAEPHRDLGLLTLCVCWGRGLQVHPQPPPQRPEEADPAAPPSPAWVDAPRVSVMTGDTLHVLSSRRIPSALHRVVVDPKEAEGPEAAGDTDAPPSESRRSIVFALRATTSGDIDLTAFGGLGSAGARDLYDSIRRSRVNINATKEARAEMRAEYRKAHGKGQGKEPEGEAADAARQEEECMDSDSTMAGEPVGVA